MADADDKLQKLYDEAEPYKCYTLEEIASVMGVTRERIRQIEQKALMRLYPKLKRLLKDDGLDPSEALEVFSAALHDRKQEYGRGNVKRETK